VHPKQSGQADRAQTTPAQRTQDGSDRLAQAIVCGATQVEQDPAEEGDGLDQDQEPVAGGPLRLGLWLCLGQTELEEPSYPYEEGELDEQG
jgi:hypothetical protein